MMMLFGNMVDVCTKTMCVDVNFLHVIGYEYVVEMDTYRYSYSNGFDHRCADEKELCVTKTFCYTC